VSGVRLLKIELDPIVVEIPEDLIDEYDGDIFVAAEHLLDEKRHPYPLGAAEWDEVQEPEDGVSRFKLGELPWT
jgi:hypothetical protein